MIHAQAVVSRRAELAPDVEIGPFTVIGDGVRIGSGTWVGPHAVIMGPTEIGEHNKIFQFASLGDAPQDKKYAGEPTRLVIGHRNVFRECCTVNRGTVHDRGETTLGDDNLLMAYSHVAHDCVLGNHIVMANCANLAGHVVLGDWVVMGGLSAVHQFCKIGAHAFLANNSAATQDIPPYMLAVGQPAKPHSVNSQGLKRRGFTPQQVLDIRRAYRVLYRKGTPLKHALEEVRALAEAQPLLLPIIEFIDQSKRRISR